MKIGISILTALTLSTSAFAVACDTTNFENFKGFGGNTLANTKTAMTWEQANTLAQSKGGALGLPDSIDKNTFISENYATGLWIGAYDPSFSTNYCIQGQPCTANSTRFQSLNGNLTYSVWTSGQPTNYLDATQTDTKYMGEHFVYTAGGLWSAARGNLTKKALVEWQGTLDCVVPQADPNTTPTSGYYCADSGGNYAKCEGFTDTITPVCTAPTTWNPATNKCEGGGVTTYQANVGSSTYQNCSGRQISMGSAYLSGSAGSTVVLTSMYNGYVSSDSDLYWDAGCRIRSRAGYTYCFVGMSPGSNCLQPGYFSATWYNESTPTTAYTCNPGDTLSGTTCTHNTFIQSDGTCPTGYTYKPANSVCPDGITWNSARNYCEATPTCMAPAVWNSTSKKCETGGTTTYDATTSNFSTCKFDLGDGYIYELPPNYISNDSSIVYTGYVGFDKNCVLVFNSGFSNDAYARPGQRVQADNKNNFYTTYSTKDGFSTDPSYVGYVANNRSVGSYSCNPGDTLSGTTCMHSTIVQTNGTCSIGTLNQTLGVCQSSKISTPAQCVGTGYTCPLGNYPCANAADSANTVNTETTPQGSNDKKNDGEVSSGGCAGTVYIFNGKDMRCRTKDAFGLAGSCCDKDKILAGFIQCKPEEKDWAKLTGNGKCHYIGDYCSKKFLGFCQTTKQTHCCFNSKLGRIIQEQGRPQLNISWGGAEAPNCRGFTAAEFQKIDFSKIDFSEFYAEVAAKAQSVINSGAIQQKLNNSINAIQTKGGK